MKTSIVGFPRVGKLRELKFVTEKYFRDEVSEQELKEEGRKLREEHWTLQKESGLDYIPSNEFSYYDGVLDAAVLFNIIPNRYQELRLSEQDTYFAMARGYQGDHGDVKALAMKKWFNTNYHYMVPEIEDSTQIRLAGTKPLEEYKQAKDLGIETKPVLVGPFTLLKLAHYLGEKKAKDFRDDLAASYVELLGELADLGAELVQLDEPCLVKDITKEDLTLFLQLYSTILEKKGSLKILLQTYFGDIRDCYQEIVGLDFDAIGLDFIEGKKTLELLRNYGFPKDKVLFAGVINGKNIWRNSYEKSLHILKDLESKGIQTVVSSSCSLLHVPFTLENETKWDRSITEHFSFAKEKLSELADLKKLTESADYEKEESYQKNVALFAKDRQAEDPAVQARVAAIKESDFTRLPAFDDREKVQKERFQLPLLPTTTIGSFPQTADVKAERTKKKKGEITEEEYNTFMKDKIAECVKMQEDIGIDVLVHGEFERNDMVEYFGENMSGFLFSEKAWVQSYGTRCVKPPIIWGDVSRKNPITVTWSSYAAGLTDHPMKGMLTGPVTILNWSFPREDISIKESTYQIGLAIRDEVLDLEKNGISIIQVDEAALREKLPLRKEDWYTDYLDWAIKAFRLVHSGVKPETQIHTHMCYSEFTDIIRAIDDMDADVITFEASRSNLEILDSLQENRFQTEVGPGVYDIHSPRVPSEEEIYAALEKMLAKVEKTKLWVNPDCGLKTRGNKEVKPSLENMVKAAKRMREAIQ